MSDAWDLDIPQQKKITADNPFPERRESQEEENIQNNNENNENQQGKENSNEQEQQQQENVEEKKEQEKPILVVDANAFIKCLNLVELSTKYRIVSSFNVLKEIRDKRARDKFMSLPFEIQSAQCSDESYNFIKSFATKTGDFASLSFNDMELIAVGYEFIKQNKKLDLLRKEPPKPINLDELKLQKQQQRQQGQEVEDSSEYSDDEEEEEDQDNENQDKQLEEQQNDQDNDQHDNEQQDNKQQEEDDDDDGWNTVPKREVKKVKEEEEEDNGKGWINPQNIEKFLQRSKQDDLDKKIGVFIMTADYAMQNVILQCGIPLLSVDNMVIRRAKRFILECFACKTLCSDNTKVFCPACKNDTLLKVSCSVNSDGSIVLYRKKDFKVNQRGFIYSIPKARGGRNNKDLILREDDLFQGEKYHKYRKQKKEEDRSFKRAMMELETGYSFGERGFKKGQQKLVVGYGKKNPNDQYRIKNKKKK